MGDATSGGGVDTDVGGAGQDTGGGRDTSPSYSDLGQSPGAMGGSAPATPSYGMSPGAMGGRIPGVVPDVKPSIYGRAFDPGVYSQPETSIVPSFDGPFGSGASTNAAVRELQRFGRGIASLSGTTAPDTSDDGPSQISASPVTASIPTVQAPAPDIIGFEPKGGTGVSPETVISRRGMPDQPIYVSPNVVKEFLGGDYDVVDRFAPRGMGMETRSDLFPSQLGGGELDLNQRGFQNIIDRPSQDFQNIIDRPQQGFQNIIDPLQTVYQRGFTPGEDVGMLYGRGFTPGQDMGVLYQRGFTPGQDIGALYGRGFDPTRIASLLQSGKKGTKQEEAQKKTIGQRLQELGKKISDFTFSDLVDYIGGVLRGDPNFKGTPSSAIDPFAQQGMGPGPAVGGGAPSPSGGGGGGGMPMPAKDPCPPGFRFDPTLQQCVPIIAPNTPTDTTTTSTTTTTPAPPATGGIADAYPFVLTPPIGTPVGNLPPVRLTT
tara:strand:+ start:140 stop:1603 length:1464 start_codon:yes stop_codon:yes gene_type:complete